MDNNNSDYNRLIDQTPKLNLHIEYEDENRNENENTINYNQFGNILEQEIESTKLINSKRKLFKFKNIITSSFIISFYFVSVIELFDLNKYKNICNKSIDLWLYLLFSLIFNFGLFFNSSYILNKYNIDKPLIIYFLIIFYKAIFTIWISIEFISNPCFEKIKDTKLSGLSSIQLLFDTSVMIFYIINIYKINNKENEISNGISENQSIEV